MKLSWFSIFRLGLIQMALGAIVVLTTSTLNRLMIVEMELLSILPGFLVALHYGIQITRPRWGFLSDMGGNRTKWIIGGMAALGLGGMAATVGTILIGEQFALGLTVSIFAYALIGLGVGASGTSLLALLATTTEPRRRAAAATITWLMMIFGIAVTAQLVGKMLDPYSHILLLKIVATVVGIAFLLTCVAIWGVERRVVAEASNEPPVPFLKGLEEIWREREARHFTIFVFLSMVAYFMQELILEPYAGLVFAFTPGESTSLSGAQNGGVFFGMLTVGIAATGLKLGSLRFWVVFGCLSSAVALSLIAALGQIGIGAPLSAAVMFLGFSNGIFAVAAIGSMMQLAGKGRTGREGTRMGLWGAAQAIAAGFGGLFGAAAVDSARYILPSDGTAFGLVFCFEAILFLIAAAVALKVISGTPQRNRTLTQGEFSCATM